MFHREYSDEEYSYRIFLDVVKKIAGIGWYGCGPTLDQEDYILYLSFHVKPERSSLLNKLLLKVISIDNSNFWYIKHSKKNRFYLTSNLVKDKSDELGSYDQAIEYFSIQGNSLGKETAKKLISLSDKLYDCYEEEINKPEFSQEGKC